MYYVMSWVHGMCLLRKESSFRYKSVGLDYTILSYQRKVFFVNIGNESKLCLGKSLFR